MKRSTAVGWLRSICTSLNSSCCGTAGLSAQAQEGKTDPVVDLL